MKLPIFVGMTIMAAAGHAQIVPGSSGHGAPTFNCAVNDTYKDIDSGLVWACGPSANTWKPTPQFLPWVTPTSGNCPVGNGSTFVSGSCGGGSLPSASTGQILSNTNGGTTYAAQGQVFYNQTADTISSIEAACSSLCTYVVTVPQTITLASSHSLSSNVQLDFRAGGLWTVNGAFTLTIPGNVSGTLNQHFAGSSTIAFGPMQTFANVEWFGAVGDWNGTTGTEDAPQIQNTVNALSSGQAILQALSYKVSATITINKGAVGITGTTLIQPSPTQYPTPPASALYMTSASADIIDAWGTNSSTGNIFGNRFNEFSIFRTVTPTGTAAGLSLQYSYSAILNRIVSEDSIRDYYFHGVGSNGIGDISNCSAINGLGSGTYYGFYADSSDGISNNSLRLHNNFYANGSTGTTYGYYSTGSSLNDLMSWNFETASASYGEYFNYTAGANSYGSSDIHLYGPINDGYKVSGITFSGLQHGTTSTVEVDGGESTSTVSPTGESIDIENSQGIVIRGHQMWGNPAIFVLVNGITSTGNIITLSQIQGLTGSGLTGVGIKLGSSANSNSITRNVLRQAGTSTGIQAVGATNNDLSGNIFLGTGTNGISLDSTSIVNTGLETNTFNGTYTNTILDNSGGSNPLFLKWGLYGSPTAFTGACGSVFPGTVSFGNDGTWTWCSGTTYTKNFLINASGLATTNCTSAASPAVCTSANSGRVVVAAAATTVVVDTTAVTAASEIQLTFDSSLGTALGVTCNTTPVQPTVSARTAATSFTLTVPSAPSANPACFSYSIRN